MFQETANRQFFQGRYILRHPFRGEIQCQEGQRYQQVLSERFEREAQTLAQLTGWNIQEIRKKMPVTAYQTPKVPFWQNIWR
jgi:hypothetical protein